MIITVLGETGIDIDNGVGEVSGVADAASAVVMMLMIIRLEKVYNHFHYPTVCCSKGIQPNDSRLCRGSLYFQKRITRSEWEAEVNKFSARIRVV